MKDTSALPGFPTASPSGGTFCMSNTKIISEQTLRVLYLGSSRLYLRCLIPCSAHVGTQYLQKEGRKRGLSKTKNLRIVLASYVVVDVKLNLRSNIFREETRGSPVAAHRTWKQKVKREVPEVDLLLINNSLQCEFQCSLPKDSVTCASDDQK